MVCLRLIVETLITAEQKQLLFIGLLLTLRQGITTTIDSQNENKQGREPCLKRFGC
jgi:hypothetical protein